MELNPLDFLPQEMWEEVIQRLDPKSLWSLLYTSKLFSTLLKENRCTFLFPLVFDVLLKKRYLGTGDVSTIHKMRLACRTWRNGIHDAFSTLQATNEFSVIKGYRRCTRPTIDRWIEQIPYDIQLETSLKLKASKIEFIKNVVVPTILNPEFKKVGSIAKQFVNIVHRDRTEVNARADFQSTLYRVLKVLGDTVTHAFIHVNFFEEDEFYIFMYKILGLLPQLKVLQIVINLYVSENTQELERAMEQFTMPQITSLEWVSLNKVGHSITSALQTAFRFTKTLEILDISGSRVHIPRGGPERLLGLLQVSPRHFYICLNQIEELENVNVAWPLESLQIEVLFNVNNTSLERVFQRLEAFNQTLTSVRLLLFPKAGSLSYYSSIDVSSRLLALDRVQFFKFRNCGICSLDFVRGLPQLRHLQLENIWKLGPTLNLDSSRVNQALQSNIWDELPALQRLDIRTKPEYGFTNFERLSA